MPLRQKRYQYLLFVGLPSLLAVLYFSLLVTGMYVSETRFSLRGAEGAQGGSELLALLGQGSGGVAADAYVVRDYIHSMDMLQTLEERLQLRAHYSSRDADFISRLSAQASAEQLLDYYRRVVQVSFDSASGILTLRARAYAPEMAQAMVAQIVELSEELVNNLRERALRDGLALARAELSLAEQRVGTAREALKGFRAQSELLNPEATAAALLALVAQLEGEAARTRTELAEARSYMRDDSARVIALNTRLMALEGQIREEKARLTGADQQVLNEIMADYERLVIEREFAEKQYLSALASLEAARIQAQAKSRYLVTFAAPSLPEQALWPRRLRSSLLFFVAASLIYGITSLVIAAIREHAGY